MYAHLLDEAIWGLISAREAYEYARLLICQMGASQPEASRSASSTIDSLISDLNGALRSLMLSELSSQEAIEGEAYNDCFSHAWLACVAKCLATIAKPSIGWLLAKGAN